MFESTRRIIVMITELNFPTYKNTKTERKSVIISFQIVPTDHGRCCIFHVLAIVLLLCDR